ARMKRLDTRHKQGRVGDVSPPVGFQSTNSSSSGGGGGAGRFSALRVHGDMAAPKEGGNEREKGDLWAIYIGGWTEIEDKILSFLSVPSSYLINRFRWNYYDHQTAACKTAAQANSLCLVSK
ncbi:hypothetical protein FOZ62_029110, partial [Perkinsus olseni]